MTLRTSTEIVEYVTTMTKDGSTSTMTSMYSWNTCQRKASSQLGMHQKKKNIYFVSNFKLNLDDPGSKSYSAKMYKLPE